MNDDSGNDLFALIQIGPVIVPSRCFLAPINTGFAEAGAPTARLIDFHAMRSGNLIGISYVGNAAIDSSFTTNENTLVLSEGGPHQAWLPLINSIERGGSVSGVQLACRASPRQAARKWRLQNPDQAIAEARASLSELPSREIERIIELFGSSAKIAANLGFRVIQIHAAHGYFVSQFLTPQINCRDDEYGRTPSLLLTRIVDVVRASAPAVVLDLRISLRDGLEDAAVEKARRYKQISDVIQNGKVDMVSLSAGHYELSRRLIYPSQQDGLEPLVEDAYALCDAHPHVVWNVAGNVRELNRSDRRIPRNLTIALGRPLIADPEFLVKWSTDNRQSIRHCDWNGQCHYYTRNKPHISCPLSQDLPEP